MEYLLPLQCAVMFGAPLPVLLNHTVALVAGADVCATTITTIKG